MEDLVHAIIMAFSMIVFVIALSVVVYMFRQATFTAENILYYADETNYYDNIEIENVSGEELTSRKVDVDTVILTLYRYYKENFCVKIYAAPTSSSEQYGDLLQVFDVNIEGDIRKVSAISNARATPEQKALKTVYNTPGTPVYLFEAPWIGSTEEDMKKRIDYYINGDAGYINNTYVNYKENGFYKIREKNKVLPKENQVYFMEKFIRYTYTGDTMTNDQGEILVEGAKPEDKIIITYTATENI